MQRTYCRADFWIAAFLILATLVVCLLRIDSGHSWGDDFAAYLNEAIAIADGRLEEQTRLNLFMHSSKSAFLQEVETSLTYVWGFPLLLVPIYRLFGFDRVTYSTLIYFKLPSVVFTALLAGVLYAFYRRRFGMCMSAVVSLLFVLDAKVLTFTNKILTEMPYIFFQMLSLLLVEMHEYSATPRRKLLVGCALGLSLWATYIIRLNGVTVVLSCALCSLIGAWRERRAPLAYQLFRVLPYALFGLLLWLSYQVLPVPTSNLSDLGQNTETNVFQSYIHLLSNWASSFFTGGSTGIFYSEALPWAFLLLLLLGIFLVGLRKDFHITTLLVGSFIGVCTLDYNQGYRYLMPLSPLILLFVGYGFQWLSRYISPYHAQATRHMFTFFTYALPVMAATLVLLTSLNNGIERFQHRGKELPSNNAYSIEAVDMYRYINSETPPDSVIAFFKPRLLYLNTQRVSYYLHTPQEYQEYSYGPYHDLEHDSQYADYFLLYQDDEKSDLRNIEQLLADSGSTDELVLVRTNKSFDLYQRIRAAE